MTHRDCLKSLAVERRPSASASPRHALNAVSEDEDSAAAAGIDVTREKLKITVLSAVMTALGGAMYVQYQMFGAPDTVSGIGISLQIVFAVVAGGVFTLHRRHPDREDFTVAEIVAQAETENATGAHRRCGRAYRSMPISTASPTGSPIQPGCGC